MNTTMATQGINYAKAIGYHSVPAAILFVVLYVPLFGWFALQSKARPTYVHHSLSVFCAIRLAAFAIRASLAGTESASENLSLLNTDQILFAVGYSGLLFSAYFLVLDIELLSEHPPPTNPFLVLTRNRRLFGLAISVAVGLGIASATINNARTAAILHKVGIILFLLLTILQALQTVILARMEHSRDNQYKQANEPFGRRHGIFILLFISLLLLIREAFSAITMANSARLNTEHFWYPLIAIPEVLAAILFSTPNLVPLGAMLPLPK